MYCVCYICRKQYRVKPPFDDPHISHGLCEVCFPDELARIKREMTAFQSARKGHFGPSGAKHLSKGFGVLDLV